MRHVLVGLVLCGGFVAAFAFLKANERGVGAFEEADLPARLRGADFDAAATARLAVAADAAVRNGVGQYTWEHCWQRAAVLTVPVPSGAGRQWRDRTVQGLTPAGFGWHPAKEAYDDLIDVIRHPADRDFLFRVMPLAADADSSDLEPFELELLDSDPQRLFIFALEGKCPGPDPRWEEIARIALRWLGLR